MWKEGHFARNCPKLSKVPLSTESPELYVCSYAFVPNSLPQWIVDTRTIKHIVQDTDEFVELHHYPVDLQTIVLGTATRKISLE